MEVTYSPCDQRPMPKQIVAYKLSEASGPWHDRTVTYRVETMLDHKGRTQLQTKVYVGPLSATSGTPAND